MSRGATDVVQTVIDWLSANAEWRYGDTRVRTGSDGKPILLDVAYLILLRRLCEVLENQPRAGLLWCRACGRSDAHETPGHWWPVRS